MKKFLIRILILSSVLVACILLFCAYIFLCIPPQFSGEYQSSINRKYETLLKTESPKIIYVAGSSGTFCVDDKYVSNELDMPFINLGLHASYGIRFISELSKANISNGDIIILGFEEEVYNNNIEKSDIYLMASGINDNLKLLKYFSFNQKIDFISYFPTYALKKIDRYIENYKISDGVYSSKNFDEYGVFNFNREEMDPAKQNIANIPPLSESYISESIIKYFRHYKEFVNDKGAEVYIMFPPVGKDSIESNKENHNKFREFLELKTGITVINDIEQILFENKYLYDYNYHCNNNGQKIYSELLVKSIKKIKEK